MGEGRGVYRLAAERNGTGSAELRKKESNSKLVPEGRLKHSGLKGEKEGASEGSWVGEWM